MFPIDSGGPMPPKCKFTKEQIISASLDLIRAEGYSAVTARSVAAALDSSPKVIFGAFQNMEELLQAKVNLQCFVKVKEDWRNRERFIADMGLADEKIGI